MTSRPLTLAHLIDKAKERYPHQVHLPRNSPPAPRPEDVSAAGYSDFMRLPEGDLHRWCFAAQDAAERFQREYGGTPV